MNRPSRWWIVFGACNVVIALALIWTTRVVLELERSEMRARSETDYQESLRLAMWRMDSWLALLLAEEAAGPHPGAGGARDEDYVPFRFEIDANGSVSSNDTDRLEENRSFLSADNIRAAMARADALLTVKLAPPQEETPLLTDADWTLSQTVRTQNEFDARVACSVPRPSGAEPSGRQVVVWLWASSPIATPALAFLRRLDDPERYSGFFLDWQRVEARLLYEIRDLFPEATLERVTPGEPLIDPLGRSLANIPVTLVTPPPIPLSPPRITGGRAALAVAWLAAVLAALAVGATLRSSIDLGERRRRFVSAVTHELRTPLTTFQLYSEMLADGVVKDPTERQEYLETLKDESQRLSTMVANVLAHSRIEAQATAKFVEETDLESLLGRLRPPLERRVVASDMALEMVAEAPGTTAVAVDPDLVGQILANLVDNAAKYAQGSTPATIRLAGSTENGSLTFTVRDHGPGVPSGREEAIFAPFDRGERDPTDRVPGVGLGLSLARSLARDLGGDLTLERPTDGGALFRLVVPTHQAGR